MPEAQRQPPTMPSAIRNQLTEEGDQPDAFTAQLPSCSQFFTPAGVWVAVYISSRTRDFVAQKIPARMMSVPELSFSASPEEVTCHGFLFDMDGTIIDSTQAVVKNWHKIGREIGVDPEVILATSHGRRSIDVLKIYEPKLANWDYVSANEALIPKEFGADAIEIPGSRAILDRLQTLSAPWAIVTSGTRPLVSGWLDRLELAHPENLVTAEDVSNGKPDPEGYSLGASKLALNEKQPSILVFEDAPAGVRAGKAAGFRVVALATTHTLDQLKDAGADWIVEDMTSVAVSHWNANTGEAIVEIRNALQ